MKYKSVEELKRHAAHDSCAFMMYFLGKNPYQCQVEWGKRLDNDELLWEADFEPRDHGKSELFVLSYPLRKICLDPNIRILIVKNTKQAAMKSLSVIKTQLEINERIKSFYAPHWIDKIGVEDISNADFKEKEGQSTWGADRIYVKRTEVSQDPTVEAVGQGGAITGGHYDIIILDDAEDPARMKTDTAYEDQIEWYTGTILQLREPWTKVIVVGTFKRASGDLYELVRKNPMFSVSIQPAILYPALDDVSYERVFNKDGIFVSVKDIKPKDTKVLCPEKWTIERLIMDKEGAITPGMSSNTWRREKMNDLSAFSENIFKREWFSHRYKFHEIEDQKVENVFKPAFKAVIGAWDTAHTDKATNDRSAFSVGEFLGIQDDRYCILPDFFRGQVEFPELRKEMAEAYVRRRPNLVIIEFKDTGIALAQEFAKPFRYRDEWITMPILRYDPDRDKTARAQASTSAWENGLIWLPPECQGPCNEVHPGWPCPNQWLSGWIQRHIDFPETTFKDDVDTTSMLVNYAQRYYPLHGVKHDFTPISDEERGRTHSRIIDMQRALGPSGRTEYVPKLGSRVLRLPGRDSARTVRSLPPGRGREFL